MHDAPVAFFFEDLTVYQTALDVADDIASHIETFSPRNFPLSDQLSRASISIAANIAEGNGRNSPTDRRRFFFIARGSLAECIPLLELAARRGLITDAAHQSLRARLLETTKMLNGLIKNPGGTASKRR